MSDGDFIREVAKVQFRKTMLDVRDIIETIPTKEYNSHTYINTELKASEFKKLLFVKLKELNYG